VLQTVAGPSRAIKMKKPNRVAHETKTVFFIIIILFRLFVRVARDRVHIIIWVRRVYNIISAVVVCVYVYRRR